jgi:DHA1 family multidrug resistance protein-like MFS transporter
MTSAIFSAGITGSSNEFHVSTEVGTLGTTLYVLGFASGPIIWGPASELMGRRWPLLIGTFGCSLFTIASATSRDIQTLMLTRFFAGVFGASLLSVVPAVFADLFNNVHRGIAICLYAMAVFVGPFISPFIGGFISMSYLGWRWTLYIPSFMLFLSVALLVLFLRETYAPLILVEKAAALRRQTHNWGIHAKQDEVEVDFSELVRKNFTRPLRMLVMEPIVFAITLYMSFVYGLIYALLEAYPYVFETVYGMNSGVSGLPFLGLVVGEMLGGVFVLSQQTAYAKKLAANDNVPIPEWRLMPCVVGGIIYRPLTQCLLQLPTTRVATLPPPSSRSPTRSV